LKSKARVIRLFIRPDSHHVDVCSFNTSSPIVLTASSPSLSLASSTSHCLISSMTPWLLYTASRKVRSK
jgi:hypothetical protein